LVNENIIKNKRQNIGSIYTMKRQKVKRNHNNALAVLIALGYTRVYAVQDSNTNRK
jgi:hypothetical protein